MSEKPKKSGAAQSKRFIEAARKAGCSEDEADLDRALKAIAKPKSKGTVRKRGSKLKK